MEYSLILENVAKHISLDPQEIEYFVSLLNIRTVKKKELVLAEGEICKTINYVISGAFRAFYKDANENESTIMFAVADWWITDMNCFVNQSPSMINIEALEESTIVELTKDDLDLLYLEVSKFERFFRILMQNSYIREQLRMLQNLSLTTEERYVNFLKKYPIIAQQVTQKNIASYLGITPEFLSVIRKNMSKGIVS